MARIGQIDLDNDCNYGGAFKLNNPPSETRTPGIKLGDTQEERSRIELSDGWKATLSKETSYIVVQSDSEYNSNDVFEQSFDAAARALDIFSILKDFEGKCVDPYEDNILWWDDGGQKHIQFTGIAGLTSGGSARLSIDGEKPERTVPEWHESFRYYRLSKTTSDLFDAYRNQFLAFESLLSDIQKKTQAHKEWIEQSLEEFQRRYDKDPIEGVGSWGGEEYDSVEEFAEEHWTNTRNRMFHAKKGKNNLSPEDANDVQLVKKRIRELSEVYSSLVSGKFGRSLGTGGMSKYAFKNSTKELLQNTEVVISADTSGWDTSIGISDISPTAEFYPAQHDESQNRDAIQFSISDVEIADIAQNPIRKYALLKRNNDEEDKIIVYTELLDEVDVTGFDTLLIRQEVRHITGSRPGIN